LNFLHDEARYQKACEEQCDWDNQLADDATVITPSHVVSLDQQRRELLKVLGRLAHCIFV
jgi:hypothetical protein